MGSVLSLRLIFGVLPYLRYLAYRPTSKKRRSWSECLSVRRNADILNIDRKQYLPEYGNYCFLSLRDTLDPPPFQLFMDFMLFRLRFPSFRNSYSRNPPNVPKKEDGKEQASPGVYRLIYIATSASRFIEQACRMLMSEICLRCR